jgi:CBS domain-containing protein
MQVRDIMTQNVISVTVGETVLNAGRIMLRSRISGLPVVDAEGNLVGMVTEGDFLRKGSSPSLDPGGSPMNMFTPRAVKSNRL